MNMLKKILRTAAIAACVWTLLPSSTFGQGEGLPPAAVMVDTVRHTEIGPTISIPGTILSRFDSRLASEVEGRVIWFEDVGAIVSEGDELVRLESTTLEIQRQEYQGFVEREEARLTFLEPEVERLVVLARDNNAAESLLNQTQSNLQVARGDLEVANARLRQIDDQISKMTIIAPFDGIVSERLINLGEMINRLDVLVRLVNPASVEIISRAPLNAVAFLETKSELEIYNDYRTGTGIVRAIVPFGDPQSHMFELRIDVPDGSWIVGESVRLDVPTALPKLALAVLRDALILRREGTFVYRVNAENIAERVLVTTGAGDGDLIEVQGDLSPDDIVVIRGGERLVDGQLIIVNE
jgi:RND family efflux transporter MFP subunit